MVQYSGTLIKKWKYQVLKLLKEYLEEKLTEFRGEYTTDGILFYLLFILLSATKKNPYFNVCVQRKGQNNFIGHHHMP